jgi:hypothetical protein
MWAADAEGSSAARKPLDQPINILSAQHLVKIALAATCKGFERAEIPADDAREKALDRGMDGAKKFTHGNYSL